MDSNYKSKTRHYAETMLKQPGIDEDTTLGELLEILQDEDKAKILDQKLDFPFYNQARVSFVRLNLKSLSVLSSCSPKALKTYIKLIQYMNQSNIIHISKSDLITITGLSKPTLISAIQELENKGLLIIYKGDIGQGEADAYYINPAISASGKIAMESIMTNAFWKEGTQEQKNKFDDTNKTEQEQFEDIFEVKDTRIRGNIQQHAEIVRRGKQNNNRQNKKGVSADQNTAPESTNKDSSQIYSIHQNKENQELFLKDPDIPFN